MSTRQTDGFDRLFSEFGHQHAARSLENYLTWIGGAAWICAICWFGWSAEAAMVGKLHMAFAVVLH
jgi:hypothetical protein